MFDKINVFKKLIILYVLLVPFYIFLELYLYPEESINDSSSEKFSTIDLIILVLVILYFYTLYKLYKFKSIGKTLLIPVLVLLEIFTFISFTPEDYSYAHMLGYYLDYFDYFMTGMIVTFVYFTDVNKEFDK